MIEYYSNKWNHAPGYQKPAKLEFNSEDISDKEIIAAIHLAVPGFKEHHEGVVKADMDKQKAAEKTHIASVTPEAIKAVADYINKHWADAYGPKMQARLTKNAKQYDMPEGVYKSEQDILNAFKDFTVSGVKYKPQKAAFEWVWMGDYPGAPEEIGTVYRTPALFKKVIPLIPKLKDFT
jgi:hypothetical protein